LAASVRNLLYVLRLIRPLLQIPITAIRVAHNTEKNRFLSGDTLGLAHPGLRTRRRNPTC
jgi:hypothetical protein